MRGVRHFAGGPPQVIEHVCNLLLMAQVLCNPIGCNERGRIARLLSGIVRVQRRCSDQLRLQLFLPMAHHPFISLNLSEEPTDLGSLLSNCIAVLVELDP